MVFPCSVTDKGVRGGDVLDGLRLGMKLADGSLEAVYEPGNGHHILRVQRGVTVSAGGGKFGCWRAWGWPRPVGPPPALCRTPRPHPPSHPPLHPADSCPQVRDKDVQVKITDMAGKERGECRCDSRGCYPGPDYRVSPYPLVGGSLCGQTQLRLLQMGMGHGAFRGGLWDSRPQQSYFLKTHRRRTPLPWPLSLLSCSHLHQLLCGRGRQQLRQGHLQVQPRQQVSRQLEGAMR